MWGSLEEMLHDHQYTYEVVCGEENCGVCVRACLVAEGVVDGVVIIFRRHHYKEFCDDGIYIKIQKSFI